MQLAQVPPIPSQHRFVRPPDQTRSMISSICVRRARAPRTLSICFCSSNLSKRFPPFRSAHLQHLVVLVVNGDGITHVFLEEDVGLIVEVESRTVAVFLGSSCDSGVIRAGIGVVDEVCGHHFGIADVVEELIGQIHVLGSLWNHVQVKAKLYRIGSKGSDDKGVVFTELCHGLCGVAVIGKHAGDGTVDDVGLGVLFGLEGYKYEFAGLLMHAEHLEAVFGVGPHTISVPRVKPADDIDPEEFNNSIPDEIFTKIAACIRVAVPYTGMIISTRESEAVRAKMLQVGISQISGGSRTSVGGYTEEVRPHDTEQFDVSDQRTLDEVVRWLMEQNHIPSFCTACYRAGRTGDRFMALCKSGQILNCCHPNALMTLTEYLEDYASPETKRIGYEMIERELERIPRENVREIARKNIEAMKNGNARDFRF